MRNLIKKILREQESPADNEMLENLYSIAKWGLQNEYSSSGCWDDNEDDIEAAIQCAIGDFEQFLSIPYPKELGNIPDNPTIYRLVRLKSPEDLNEDKLGKSWFSNPQQIKEPEFFQMLDYLKPMRDTDTDVYVIKGETNVNNIDMPRTLWERSTQWWENEIVVKDESKINVIDIAKLWD